MGKKRKIVLATSLAVTISACLLLIIQYAIQKEKLSTKQIVYLCITCTILPIMLLFAGVFTYLCIMNYLEERASERNFNQGQLLINKLLDSTTKIINNNKHDDNKENDMPKYKTDSETVELIDEDNPQSNDPQNQNNNDKQVVKKQNKLVKQGKKMVVIADDVIIAIAVTTGVIVTVAVVTAGVLTYRYIASLARPEEKLKKFSLDTLFLELNRTIKNYNDSIDQLERIRNNYVVATAQFKVSETSLSDAKNKLKIQINKPKDQQEAERIAILKDAVNQSEATCNNLKKALKQQRYQIGTFWDNISELFDYYRLVDKQLGSFLKPAITANANETDQVVSNQLTMEEMSERKQREIGDKIFYVKLTNAIMLCGTKENLIKEMEERSELIGFDPSIANQRRGEIRCVMDAWDPTNTELNKQLDETIERLTQNRIESGVATIESKKTSKASRMIGAVKNAIGRDVYPINKTLPNKDIKDYVLPGKLEAKYIPAP
jgi:hypothetical protein